MIFDLLIVTICVMLLVPAGYWWTQPPNPWWRGYGVLAVLLIIFLVLWLLGIGPGTPPHAYVR